jgi:hypothetical protein
MAAHVVGGRDTSPGATIGHDTYLRIRDVTAPHTRLGHGHPHADDHPKSII